METNRPRGTWKSLEAILDPAQIGEVKRSVGSRLIQENMVHSSAKR